MKPLPQNYNHKETEKRWQQSWEEAKIYAWDESQPRNNTFVIDTPPPTVSGLLHMGHVYSYTQADFVARYQRMSGKTVFYPMGFDDNGLPTERLVEKVKKVRATDMSREEFIQLCEGVAEEARGEFRALFESIALSIDWKQEYHTISEDSRKISQLSFLDLYNKDRAYRKLQPMLWDPVDQTAIAQAEIEDKEMPSQKNYLEFGLIDAIDSLSSGESAPNTINSLSLRERVGVRASKSFNDIPKVILDNARKLRKDSTDVEKIIWSALRNRQFDFKFRRQHPVGNYITDFACVEAKLVIELDGGQHNEENIAKKDVERTKYLEKQGFQVIRIWNNEVLDNLDGVLELIWLTLHEASRPHPNPLPEGEGTKVCAITEEISSVKLQIMTTRPELLGACVAVIYNPEDERYNGKGEDGLNLQGKQAVTPVFGVKVDIIADSKVDMEKGTGLVMCCTFGDETDIAWWREHNLATRVILNKYGKIETKGFLNDKEQPFSPLILFSGNELISSEKDNSILSKDNTLDIEKTIAAFEQIQNLKSRTTARAKMLELLAEEGAIFKDPEVGVHAEPCAERSGSPLEILPTNQWFVKILDKKEELKAKAAECNWHPQFMKIRMDQWIDGLSWDWCISRQRYFGVPFPVWYVEKKDAGTNCVITESKGKKVASVRARPITASPSQLPVNPLSELPDGLFCDIERNAVGHWYARTAVDIPQENFDGGYYLKIEKGTEVVITAEADVMDTWATSSVSPQLSSKGINSQYNDSISSMHGSHCDNSLSRLRGRVREGAEDPSDDDKSVIWKNSKELINNARELRKNSTDVEHILWQLLRRKQLKGYKFRRQHPIEKYVADFVCMELNLIIELDGGQHAEQKQYDEARSKFLEAKGYKVLRFWNNEVLENIDGVMEVLWNELPEDCPHPNPLPEGEGIRGAAPHAGEGIKGVAQQAGEGMKGKVLEGEGTNPYVLDAERHSKLFPADLRPQAHEIIRTWAFYTIVKAYLHEGTIPWKNLMISGWCLAADKTKMSKSKGNVVTPVDLIEEKGSDVVRYWASTSRLGADTAYSEDVLKIGRKLVTKLWNATKFAAIHLDKLEQTPKSAKADVESGIINEPLDLWVLTRLGRAIDKATQEFEKFEYCTARGAAEDFFWNDFCDNYLELVKVRVYGEAEGTDAKGQKSAVHTIYHCLDGILRLFAPITPHITEELYSHIFVEKTEELGGSIHTRGTWPASADYPVDEAAEKAGIACVSILNAVRKLKAERNVSLKWPLNFVAISHDGNKNVIGALEGDLRNVTNSSEIIWGEKDPQAGFGLTSMTEDGLFKVTADFAESSDDKKLEAAG